MVDQLMKDAISLYWGIAVGCFIVHDQFFSNKIKTIRNCIVWALYHLFLDLGRKIRKLVYCLQGIH